ncbi:MAG: PKD domain-containing protein, partial [Bacteroidales bacterium]|nr:PKD domain-containing protein [Bacteroidales bacterium]
MRLLSVLLIITFFVTNSFSKIKPRLAPLNPEYLEYLEKEKAGEIRRCTEDGHYLGYRPSPLYIITEIPGQNETDKFKSTEAYPAKYDLRELELVTSVKDQGDIGACWSFGVIGSIESNWLMNGLGEFDLSEENMATCHGFNYAKDEGGNLTIPVCYLVNFKGPLLEIEDPYMTDPLFGFCKTSGFNLTPAKYVSEARWIGGNKKAIKNTLMKYGAVTATITMEGYASYYNGTDNTMYYSGTDLNDHMILIVGWDDNKPVTGGTASPAGTHTGAWIIRNSWGDDWGEDGYAYVSYEDITFASHAAYFPTTFETNEIETVFMYDELGVVTWAGYPSDSVSALIKYNAPSKYFIDKIGVYIVAAGTTIDIEIYASKSGNTLSGLLASEYDIEISEAGYHLFDIAAMVEGDFYIKIKYLNPYTTYQVAVENEEENYALPDIEKGVCWMSLDEEEWDPLGSDIEDGEWDLCIKAYASSVNLPRAFFNVDKKEICKGSSVVFTDKSLGDNNTYSWNFGTGASPQTANTAGPHTVTYSTPGKKTISLTVTGTEGTNTITRDGYINVVDDIYVHLAADALIAIADIPIEIKAYGADEYSWSPSTGLDKTTG